MPKGTLIIRAAEQVGIEIPRFCDHPLLEPVAACRACLIEIEGQPKPQPACAIPVADGMEVRTSGTSDMAATAQRGVMEFLLINHPLDCPVCDKGGECPLQNQAMSHGRGESRFTGTKRTFPKPISAEHADPARPRALRLVRPVHPVRRPDRRRPVHRAAAARWPADRRHRRGHPVQLVLLRQHRADLPGRRPDQLGLPLPLAPVRPGLHPDGVRALRQRLLAAHRRAPLDGPAPAGVGGPRGQRGLELRQGPVRVPVPVGRPPRHPAGPRRRRAGRVLVARGRAPRGRCAGRVGSAHGRPAGRQADPRGQLRVREVRARRAGHRQHRLPDPALECGRGRLPALGRLRLRGGRHLRRPRGRPHRAARRAGARGGVADHLPAPAHGHPTRSAEGPHRRPVRLAAARPSWPPTCWPRLPARRRRCCASLASGEGDAAAAVAAEGSIILVGERAAQSPGALSAVGRPGRRPPAPRLAWVPRRAGERGALEAGALAGLLPWGRPADRPRRPGPRRRRRGTSTPTPCRPRRAWTWPASSRRWHADHADAAGCHRIGGADRRRSDCRSIGCRRLPPRPSSGGSARSSSPASRPPTPRIPRRSSPPWPQRRSSSRSRPGPPRSRQLADVVLPVGVITEKSGTLLDWEGRARPFGQVMRDSTAITDARALSLVARAMGRPLGSIEVADLRAELAGMGRWQGPRPEVAARRRARHRGSGRRSGRPGQLAAPARRGHPPARGAGTCRHRPPGPGPGLGRDRRRPRPRRWRPGHGDLRAAARSPSRWPSPRWSTAWSGCPATRSAAP